MDKPITAQRVIVTSFFVDLLDIVVNLLVTLMTGSVVMMAELIQGVSDLAASGFLFVALKRPKREKYVWTFISALTMLLIASSLSFYFGYRRFIEPQEIESIVTAYVALTISTVSNGYAFYLSCQRLLGKDWSFKNLLKQFAVSPLIMTKNAFVLDLMGMSAAVVGLVALVLYQLLGDLRFDGLGAMGIGITLGILSVKLLIGMKKSITSRLKN